MVSYDEIVVGLLLLALAVVAIAFFVTVRSDNRARKQAADLTRRLFAEMYKNRELEAELREADDLWETDLVSNTSSPTFTSSVSSSSVSCPSQPSTRNLRSY